eukprot:1158280-Pelagomonas_calceolata.AAC.7
MGANTPALTQKFSVRYSLQTLMNAPPARPKWCKQGNQTSTVFAHNLGARTCLACSPGQVGHDLQLNLSEQLCFLNSCQGSPRGGGPESRQSACGKMSAKMGSARSCPPACLISSNGWALHQGHVLGGWGGGPGHHPNVAGTMTI